MKMFARIILVAVFMVLMTSPMWAANSDSHTLTVTISAINELAVSGDLGMTINAATPGQEPDPAIDATSTIDYTTNSATNKKITGQYSISSGNDNFLTIEATLTSTSGTSLGQVTLSDAAAVDLVNGLTQCADAGETLTYEVTATVEQTVGNHVFVVTYTLTDE